MKRILTLLTAVLLTATVFGQSPEKMSYQAVIRNASNELVASQEIGMQISILQGTADGTAVYVETQIPTTNANGLVTVEIGTGTTTGDFSTIDWTNGTYFVKTETDPAGSTNYTITGTSQLLSVPYALYAKTAGNGFGGDYEDLTNKPNLTNYDGSITNEIQTLSIEENVITLTDGGSITLPVATVGFDGKYTSLTDVPADLADGDDNTQLTETQVDGFVANNGYLTAETDNYDGSITNEIQTLSIEENVITLTDGGSITLPVAAVGFDGKYTSLTDVPADLADGDDNTQLTETQVDGFVANNGYLTAETDPVYTASNAASITSTDITNLGNLSGTNTGDMTNAEVKTAYEANSDTNPFTDSDKTKLDGMATGAEVNTVNSVAGKTGAVTLAKADVGLGNVNNTSDANKTVSTATQTALDLKANLASPTFTGTVSGVTQTHVGLGNVDNTSDANKPVSTATQTALDLKVDKVAGKVLSANDYTDVEKTKLAALDGSETKVTAGTNVTVTGTGTVATPYVINTVVSMTQAERDLLTVVEGLIVYNTTTHKPNFYNGTEWMNYNGTTAATLLVGDSYHGGIIAYIFVNGDPGYVADEIHGLIAAPTDYPAELTWYNGSDILTGATGIELGTGNANTNTIIAAQGNNGTYAAKACADLVLDGYDDWYLPSKDELNKLYINRVAVGNFAAALYHSSTEFNASEAYEQFFDTFLQRAASKNYNRKVRAVRTF